MTAQFSHWVQPKAINEDLYKGKDSLNFNPTIKKATKTIKKVKINIFLSMIFGNDSIANHDL